MAFANFEVNWFRIDGEIAENHAILVDHFKFDGEYRTRPNSIKHKTLTQ